MKFEMDDFFQVFFLIVVLFSIFYVKDIYYFKGKHNMCTDLKGVYLNNGTCTSNDIYQIMYNQTKSKYIMQTNRTIPIGVI